LQLKKYELVIQAGVAGCFDTNIPLGTVVVINKETIADQSVVELNKLKTLFDLKLVPQDQPPYKKGWLNNPWNDLLKKTKLKIVSGISVNQISTSKKIIKFYRELFNPVTESMEGAALHYVCLSEGVPFVQLRSISNYIGERNKKNWNMNDSIINLNGTLIRLINNY
jgi:futalosine hydrolase